MRTQTDIRHDITNAIIDALQNPSGSLPPWRKPWRDDPNAVSQQASQLGGDTPELTP